MINGNEYRVCGVRVPLSGELYVGHDGDGTLLNQVLRADPATWSPQTPRVVVERIADDPADLSYIYETPNTITVNIDVKMSKKLENVLKALQS